MIKAKRKISLFILAIAFAAIGCNPGIIDVPPPQVTDASAYFWKHNSFPITFVDSSETSKSATIILNLVQDSTGLFIIEEKNSTGSDVLTNRLSSGQAGMSGFTEHSVIPLPSGFSIMPRVIVTPGYKAPPVNHIIEVPNSNIVIAASETAGVFYSHDGGANWQISNAIFGNNNFVSAFAVQGSTIFAGTSQGMLVYSTDGGLSWNYGATFAAGKPIVALAANSSSHALYVSTGDNVFRTETPQSPSSTGTLLATNLKKSMTKLAFIVVVDSGRIVERLFGGTTSYDGNSLYSRVWDNGMDWQPEQVSPKTNTVYSLLATSSQHIFCSTDSSIYYFDSSRVSWVRIHLTDFGHALLRYDETNGVIAATAGSNFKVIQEDGTLMDRAPVHLPRRIINDFSVSNENYLAATDSGIFSKTNTAQVWTSEAQGILETHNDTTAMAGEIVLLRSRISSATVDSSWEACTMLQNPSRIPFPVTGRIIGNLDSLSISGKTYSDVLAVRYAYEQSPNTVSHIPYWVIYYGRNEGPLVISLISGTKTLHKVLRLR